MIPRAARRLETTLLSSRQSLPRPARLYSTPSRKANAPALATVQVPRTEFPPYFPQNHVSEQIYNAHHGSFNDLDDFLKRKMPYTILPTPLPSDRTSEENQRWFMDTAAQDMSAVMDACLHNLYDVPRAKAIFERLRQNGSASMLETRMYNAFLEAYLEMATSKDFNDRSYWLSASWELFNIMEQGVEKVLPNASTYAVMLLTWNRFGPNSENPTRLVNAMSPNILLENMVGRQMSLSHVVSDRVFTSSEEATQVIRILSQAAVQSGLPGVLSELGQAEAMGTEQPDVLEGVPDVRPVMKEKKQSAKAKDEPGVEDGEPGPDMEIPFNLHSLRRHLADVALARRVLPDDVVARQRLLEESVYDVAVERLKKQADKFAELGLGSPSLQTPDLRRWMWDWHVKLKSRLEEEIKSITKAEASMSKAKTHQALSPYLSLVEAERLSLITILEIMRLQGSGGIVSGMKTARALISVGKAVEIEYKAQMCKSSRIHIPTTPRFHDGNVFSGFGYNNLLERRIAAAKHMSDGEAWTSSWSQAVRSKIGGILVDCLMDVAEVTRTVVDKKTMETVSENQPAFFHAYEYLRGQKLGVIRLNPVVSERLAEDNVRETLHPRHLPMLVKPKPWLDYDNGGYLFNKSFAMRFKDSIEQQNYLKEASQKGQVELVYAGLDILGSTPWKINRKIFDVVLEVWNSGERMGKMPPAVYDRQEPVPPEDESDLKARSIFMQRQRAYYQGKANNHSDRCSVNYKIEVARAFLGDTLYLPHNLDFRGRAYPIPPHLNHIGDDLCRGLLQFGESKPLGERGLRWLKIHLANLYGFDKANFDEREQWVMQRLEEVYDSATKPLEGRRWWAAASDPWQCLAACQELHAALECDDPTTYKSALPVHQDGTCNGLQHYAALGGDATGARQVNLASGDRPSDVYTHVGQMVEKMMAEDIKKGHEYAKLLEGKITRKVVKQTVMTTVYGVTFVGAREQIERQLKDREDIPEEECWNAASYLAKLVLTCIGDLFSGANSIQNWLNICARLIAKSIQPSRLPEAMLQQVSKRADGKVLSLQPKRLKKEQMTSVIWTTPLGLPIVQPYRKTVRKQIMTSLQSVYISDPNAPAEVNSMKQASAFPPNFIHSLDATHMMLTALKCNEKGLTFASVHDSYWTHACDIDTMSEVIRDTFIALHSSDVLGKLQTEFMERYKDYRVPLVTLRSGQIIKNLHEAGSRIVATPEQAKSLEAIKELLVVSESEQPTVAETKTTLEMNEYEDLLSQLQDKDKETSPEMETLEEDVEFEESPSPIKKSKSLKSKTRKAVNDLAARQLEGKFVNLTDLLPPLPKKGTFKVESIKSSQYFFS